MPVKNERDHYRARLSSKNTKKLKKIVRRTKRSPNTEVNLAFEEYKPRVIFRDNGK